MSVNPFKPAWWLKNSHLQTIWPVLCRKPVKDVITTRERLELPDGDFIDLDWIDQNDAKPLVIILHGFEGSIDSHYARGMLRTLRAHGWRGVLMHFRGCSGEPNRLARGYHSGETSDLAYLVQTLREREPNVPLAAIGYSLGGNVLLKWLGETHKDNPLQAAIAISVPFDLDKACQRIQHGFSRFYQWYFLRCLRQRLKNKFQVIPPPVDPVLLDQAHNFYDFDDLYTAPLHGFSGANEYYSTASSRQYLRHVEVPTLILHAKDDPFMSVDVIPEDHELSPRVQLELSDTGGHVGFVTGRVPWRPKYWLEERIPYFLREHL